MGLTEDDARMGIRSFSRRLSTSTVGGVSGMTLLLGFNAAVGGFLFGYDTGSMSAALLQVKRPSGDRACPGLAPQRLSSSQQELVVSFVVLGAFIGAALSGWLNDKFGRRPLLLVGSLVFTVGAALMAAARGLEAMLTARIIVGVGVGISSHTVPLYIAECAPAAHRGSLCFLNDAMIVVGQVAAAALSTALFFAEARDGWRVILGAAVVPSVMMFLGFLWMPESPRWLISQGRREEAKAVTRLLRGPAVRDADVDREFQVTLEGAGEDAPLASAAPSSLLRAFWKDVRVRRALLLGCALQALQQWGGINTIMYYGASMLQKAGASPASGCFSAEAKHDVATTILFAAAQVLGVFYSWAMVDRLGRRPLLLASLLGVAASLVAVGCIFSQNAVRQAPVVACVFAYLVCFGAGLSPVPWTVNAEIYPQHVRAQCISVATSVNWIMNFVVAQTSLTLSRALSTHHDKSHPDGVFWLYAGISVLGIFFVWREMPETKGLTLEQISDLFSDASAVSSK